MLELCRGLSPAALTAVADLERRTVAADGGRLKLEWGALNAGGGRDVEEILYWDDSTDTDNESNDSSKSKKLLGFAGVYSFGSSNVEIAGMVDPSARNRGIGGQLLDAAIKQCQQREATQALLVIPRQSAAGHALGVSRGGIPDHSEHALLLSGQPTPGPDNPDLTLRRAGKADLPEVYRLLSAGFDWVPRDLDNRMDEPNEPVILVELNGRAVSTLRLTLDDERGGIYGFVVDPALQGRGIGREVLRRSCQRLYADGATEIGLEVAVDNERALGLYTSVGFRQVTTEDYLKLPLDQAN